MQWLKHSHAAHFNLEAAVERSPGGPCCRHLAVFLLLIVGSNPTRRRSLPGWLYHIARLSLGRGQVLFVGLVSVLSEEIQNAAFFFFFRCVFFLLSVGGPFF